MPLVWVGDVVVTEGSLSHDRRLTDRVYSILPVAGLTSKFQPLVCTKTSRTSDLSVGTAEDVGSAVQDAAIQT